MTLPEFSVATRALVHLQNCKIGDPVCIHGVRASLSRDASTLMPPSSVMTYAAVGDTNTSNVCGALLQTSAHPKCRLTYQINTI